MLQKVKETKLSSQMYPRKKEIQRWEERGPKNASTFQKMEPGNEGGDGAHMETKWLSKMRPTVEEAHQKWLHDYQMWRHEP